MQDSSRGVRPGILHTRLGQLSDNLHTLRRRVRGAIAGVIGSGVAGAVSDAVRAALGGETAPDAHEDPVQHHGRRRAESPAEWWEDAGEAAQDDGWTTEPQPDQDTEQHRRGALATALYAALCWLGEHKSRRP